MRRLAATAFRSFLQGLIILSPIAITAYIIFLVFDSVDSMVPWVPRGLGFFIVVTIVTFIGFMGTRFFVGRIVVDSFDYFLEHIPGIKYVYTSIKDVLDSFVGDKKRFNKPVFVCTNLSPEMWRIGFMTQEDLSYLGMVSKCSVYLPHSYAISGWVIIVDPKHVKPITKMNAAEAMKFAVSGGITSIEEEKHVDRFV